MTATNRRGHPINHGGHSGYRQGCRCDPCREGDRLYRKRLREGRNVPRLVDSTGTARRLQALAAIGWSATELGRRLNTSRAGAQTWCRGRTPRVLRATAQRVAALYEELSGTPGPDPAARELARRNGWAPPLLWDELDIDNPAAQPHDDTAPPPRRDRIHADDVTHLARFGMPLDVIAARLGVQPSSIERHLERDRARICGQGAAA